MPEEQAKVHVSLRDGVLEFAGSEEFVAQQVALFKDLIHEKMRSIVMVPEKPANKPSGDQAPAGTIGIGQYPNVLAEHDDKVQILKNVPGSSTQEKAINTALLYLWAKDALGVSDVPYQEIRGACEHQACLDSGNFSAHMKSAKQWFLVSGSGKNQTVKLTIPGKAQAEVLLKSLQSV